MSYLKEKTQNFSKNIKLYADFFLMLILYMWPVILFLEVTEHLLLRPVYWIGFMVIWMGCTLLIMDYLKWRKKK